MGERQGREVDRADHKGQCVPLPNRLDLPQFKAKTAIQSCDSAGYRTDDARRAE